MNSTQIAALTPEHEDFTTGWYNRFAKHPFYGPHGNIVLFAAYHILVDEFFINRNFLHISCAGVNSGVMLMNLTRMRDIEWQELVMAIYNEFKYEITWGDQDIINILFYLHPGWLAVCYSTVSRDSRFDLNFLNCFMHSQVVHNAVRMELPPGSLHVPERVQDGGAGRRVRPPWQPGRLACEQGTSIRRSIQRFLQGMCQSHFSLWFPSYQ